jgi:GNAT superfamily N-acetyltransferase
MAVGEFSLEEQVRATEENLWTLWSRFGRAPGCQLHEEDGAVWFDTPLKLLPYNTVISCRAEGDADALIGRIVAHYQSRNVPFAWIVHPSAMPSDIGKRLEQRGMQHAENVPGMTMDLADLPPRDPCPAGIEIREVTSDEDLRGAQELIAWRWDVPAEEREAHWQMNLSFGVGKPGSPLRCWVAYLDGQPVSKALLNMDAGCAGIHGVATKPEARGKGLARTLTLEGLHTGREAGYRLAMLHTSAMARSLYEKIGFRQVSEFGVYVAGANFHI